MALDYTVTFNGVTIGNGTNVQILAVSGLEDLPDARTSDVPLPTAHGELSGNDYADGRDIVIDFLVLDSGAGDYFTTVEAVKAMTLIGSSESTLSFQLPGRAARRVSARCRRRAIPVNDQYQFRYGLGSMELHATDPRIYDVVPLQASPTPFVAGSAGIKLTLDAGVNLGLKLTLDAGVNLGLKMVGISSSGLVTATNAGYIDTFPVMVFRSPTAMSAFSVTNQTTGQVFAMTQTVSAGDVLTADMTAAQTGSSTNPISLNGVSRYGLWTPPRVPFRLAPGANVLRFDVTGDQSSTCLVTWSNATM